MTPDYEPPSAAKYPDGTWERVTLTDYWSARHKLPYSLLLWAIEHQDDQNALAQAAQMFWKWVRLGQRCQSQQA